MGFDKLTLADFTTDGRKENRDKREMQIKVSRFDMTDVHFPLLEEGEDIIGNYPGGTTGRIYIKDLLNTAAFLLLCKEAQMLRIEHPIVMPWHEQCVPALTSTMPQARMARNFKYGKELPFLDGFMPDAAFRNLQLRHVAHSQIYSWVKSEAFGMR